MKARDLTLISASAAVISVCAWISIPSAVAFTMQLFGIFCSLFLLGGKRGTLSVLIYVLLGCAGLPVFSGFSGGFGVLFGPTGGFIPGFLAAGLVMWALEKYSCACVRAAAALAAVYLFGSIGYWLHAGGSFAAALLVCAVPYVVPDVLKLCLAQLAAGRLKKLLKI